MRSTQPVGPARPRRRATFPATRWAAAEFATLTCGTDTAASDDVDRTGDHIATCSDDGTAKFLLGPAVLEGAAITDASAGTSTDTGAWIVNLDFDSEGSAIWATFTAANVGNQVAITLDGRVVSAPTINNAPAVSSVGW